MKKHIAQAYDSTGPNSTVFAVIIILQVCCEEVIIEKGGQRFQELITLYRVSSHILRLCCLVHVY